MAFSKEKAFDRAERFAAKGQHDKAAREYQAIVDADPKEIRAWLMLADCLVRCGDAPRAIERYLQVGGYYIQKRDHQKALAVYRQVLNLDATRIDVQLRVAALNLELGRVQDAVAMYERVAALQMQAGKTVDGLQTYRIVADADPTAVSRRLRLAELYSRERQNPEAVDAFREAGRQLLIADRKADYVRVAERLLYHDASDMATIRQLAAVYLELGDPRRALMKLNGLLQADAADREGIELLAQTFMALGKPDKAVSAIGELARALRESGTPEDLVESARVLRLGLAWAPGQRDLVSALAKLEPSNVPEAPRRPVAVETAIEVDSPDGGESIEAIDDGEVEELDDDDLVLEDAEPAARDGYAVPTEIEEVVSIDSDVILVADDHATLVPGQRSPSMTASVLSEASRGDSGLIDADTLTDFDKILFEARVYIKYRLFEHALDHVSAALRQQPEHVGALSLQTRALTELGRSVEAADAHAHVARLVIDSDPKLAREHIAAALSLAPGHVRALQVEERLRGDASERDEVSIEAPLGPEPIAEAAPTELLRVDTRGEVGANLLDIRHGSDGVEEEDFAIDVDVSDDGADEAVPEVVEIEDRFGLDSASDDDYLLADDSQPTGPFEVSVDLPPAHVQADATEIELLGPEASGAFDELSGGFDRMEAEVVEHGERNVGGIDLLEPGVDSEALDLDDHVQRRRNLHPATVNPSSAEPDLVELSMGRTEAQSMRDTPAAAPAEPPGGWPDISEDIAEARFFIDQGLDEDADAAIVDLRRRFAGHPALSVLPDPTADAPAAMPVESGASTPLVLLSDEDEDDDAYLSAIFSAPAPQAKAKRKTGARVASENVDSQSAFDLGVAYREMGLIDQAVTQFEAAADDPDMRVRALVMLGTLRLQQGNADEAVANLEEAVQLATNDDEVAEANYELGVLYEKIGDTGKAIARLECVSAGYRDRDERLGQLQQ